MPDASEEEAETSSGKPTRKRYGIFADCGIKGLDRTTILERIAAELAKKISDPGHANSDPASESRETAEDDKDLIIEIDQTGAELHQRTGGTLDFIYHCLHKINLQLKDKIQGQFCQQHNAVLWADSQKGLTVTFTLKIEGRPKFLRAQFPDAFLTSGWLLTSDVNAFDEFVCTYSAMTSNPEKIFSLDPKTQRCHLLDGTHNFRFISCPLPEIVIDAEGVTTFDETRTTTKKIRLRLFVEGDDGIGKTYRLFLVYLWLIRRNYAEVGMEAKVDCIVDGRAEFIGAHFACEAGCVKKEVGWIPAISRYVCKVAALAKVGSLPEHRLARAYALGSLFGGKNYPIALAFMNQADSYMRKILASQDVEGVRTEEEAYAAEEALLDRYILCDAYSVEARVINDGTTPSITQLGVFKDLAIKQFQKPYPEVKTQVEMMRISTQKPLSVDEFSKFCIWAEGTDVDEDDEASYLCLPKCLQ